MHSKIKTWTSHGKSQTPEYGSWWAMIWRCSPNSIQWKNYGGRGIVICERWRKFENFFADMGPKPTPRHGIDRIDNNGNYCAENCRWATMAEQNNNKRNNAWVEFGGKRQTIAQWARESCVREVTLRRRLKDGWAIGDALTTPRTWWPKLTPEKVTQARQMISGGMTQVAVAKFMGVTKQAINRMLHGISWRCVQIESQKGKERAA